VSQFGYGVFFLTLLRRNKKIEYLAKKEPQRKKDNALNCIILFQISRETG
jgi:hypothetical protein